MNVLEMQIGAALIGFWLISLAGLWVVVDRPNRPGPVRSHFAIEFFMLLSIVALLLGGSLVIKGSGWFE